MEMKNIVYLIIVFLCGALISGCFGYTPIQKGDTGVEIGKEEAKK
jgi:uncharacterized membrane protein YtjA (UPF0391 family)